MRHWPTLAAVSGVLALAACGRGAPTLPAAGAEPELRIGLADGAANVALGGDGELFVTDDGNGQPIASIPAGERWSAVPEGPGVALVRPDGSRTPAHPGISAVNVTENRFAMADGRRYRGRLNVVRSAAGLLLVNRVGLEGYLAGVIGLEMGPRRPDELQALLAQAIVSRTFAVRNRGRWEARGYDLTSDTRDQVYNGVAAETEQVWNALRASVFNNVTWPDFAQIPPDAPVMKYRTLVEDAEQRVGDAWVTPVPVNHTVPTTGFIVHDGGTGFIFSGDTGPTEALWKAARGLRGLRAAFVECAFPNRMAKLAEVARHMTPDLLRRELDKLPPDLPVWIYHIKPQFYEETAEELALIPGNRVQIIEQDKTYTL